MPASSIWIIQGFYGLQIWKKFDEKKNRYDEYGLTPEIEVIFRQARSCFVWPSTIKDLTLSFRLGFSKHGEFDLSIDNVHSDIAFLHQLPVVLHKVTMLTH